MTQKTKDKYDRWRCITVGFRVSPEENEEINRMVRLSGLSKQEYITRKLMNKDVVVSGTSPRVYKGLKVLLQEVNEKLSALEGAIMPDPELQETIRIVAKTLGKIKGDTAEMGNEV